MSEQDIEAKKQTADVSETEITQAAIAVKSGLKLTDFRNTEQNCIGQ